MSEEPPELLTTGEVARMLKVARSTVLSWAAQGLLGHTRTPGGQYRFYRAEVEAILQVGSEGQGSAPSGKPVNRCGE